MSENLLQKFEQSVPLALEDMYDAVSRSRHHEQNITLSEAQTEMQSHDVSGACRSNAVPDFPHHLDNTGIWPPDEETLSEISKFRTKPDQEKISKSLTALIVAGRLTLADTKGHRVRAAYRLVRYAAMVMGMQPFSETLYSPLYADQEGPYKDWAFPRLLQRTNFPIGLRAVRRVFEEIENNTKAEYSIVTEHGVDTYRGVTLLPPPIPDHFYGDRSANEIADMRFRGVVPKDYDPKADANLTLYCEAMTILARQLKIDEGSPEEPHSGVYGLAGLMNPHSARIAWPMQDELLLYEGELLDRVYRANSCWKGAKVREYLRRYFGLSNIEAVDISNTAMAYGERLYARSVGTWKQVILQKIEDLEEYTHYDDPRAAIAGIKTLSQILGLTNTDVSDSMDVLRNLHKQALDGSSGPKMIEYDGA